jgi:hypothetical protein
MKRRQLASKGGGCDGLDSKVYLFILESHQFEVAVRSNDLFISCHVLGSVDAMLKFIHAVGLLEIACWFRCMHAHNQSFWCLYVVCTYSSIFVVPSKIVATPGVPWQLSC